MKREVNFRNSRKRLISYFTCNNETTDLVSGADLQRSNSMEVSYYGDPVFVNDPANQNRMCVRKRSGSCYMTPNISFYSSASETPRFNWIWTLSETNCIRKGHHIITFDVYIDQSVESRVIYNDGDVDTGGEGNNGICIFVKNGIICTVSGNNTSVRNTNTLCQLGDAANKWNTVTVEYMETQTGSDVHITLENETGVYSHNESLSTPTSGNSRIVILAGSFYKQYSKMQDTVDLFKEIKLFEIED